MKNLKYLLLALVITGCNQTTPITAAQIAAVTSGSSSSSSPTASPSPTPTPSASASGSSTGATYVARGLYFMTSDFNVYYIPYANSASGLLRQNTNVVAGVDGAPAYTTLVGQYSGSVASLDKMQAPEMLADMLTSTVNCWEMVFSTNNAEGANGTRWIIETSQISGVSAHDITTGIVTPNIIAMACESSSTTN